jgi:alpha-beta hydrolase superfamily lysophospholipase
VILPCVIYLHTHNSSRLEAREILPVLLPSNINVFTFDFSGSGLSEGEFVTLGWNEKEDLKTVIEFIRNEEKATCIGLWGRGMGAVTSLLYADQDPCIGGIVLDSPFLSLKMLAEEELEKRSSLPGFIKSSAFAFVRKTILAKAKFDVNDINTLEHVMHTFVPAIFSRASEDECISEHHLQDLYSAYLGEKKLVKFSGNHNSRRPNYFLDSVAIFFYNCLQCESISIPAGLTENKENSDDSYEIL